MFGIGVAAFAVYTSTGGKPFAGLKLIEDKGQGTGDKEQGMNRLFVIAAFLLLGHAVIAGLYWGLVNVPESNVAMLGLSTILVVAIVVLTGWIEATAILGWLTDERPAVIARRAFRGVPAFFVSLVIFAAIWWLTRRALAWHDAHSGEIDAAFMSRFGSARTAWVHLIYMWGVLFVRWVLGLALGLGVLAAGATLGWRALGTRTWVTRVFSVRRLILLAALLAVFFVLPWSVAYWRPRGLPPTSIETAFVAAKLIVLLVVAHVGWALILRTASRS